MNVKSVDVLKGSYAAIYGSREAMELLLLLQKEGLILTKFIGISLRLQNLKLYLIFNKICWF
jgi:hypothetical protein